MLSSKMKNTDLLCRLTSHKNLLLWQNLFKWFVMFVSLLFSPFVVNSSSACVMTRDSTLCRLYTTHICRNQNVLFIYILLSKLMLKYFIAEKCENCRNFSLPSLNETKCLRCALSWKEFLSIRHRGLKAWKISLFLLLRIPF
jgi:hypothetical protein